MDDLVTIRRELTKAVRARRVPLTPMVKRQIYETACDMAAAANLRDMLNAGQPIPIEDYFRLRQQADASRRALLGESTVAGPSRIEVELVESRHELRPQIEALRAENAALKARLGIPNPPIPTEQPAGESGGSAGVPQPTPSADSPAATPAPSGEKSNQLDESSNVVPIRKSEGNGEPQRRPNETVEAYVARRRAWAGDKGPQALRVSHDGLSARAFYVEGVPDFGASRFDHPLWK